ncbi:style cell-cycle inhibitor 1-A [Gastrolobium bilobum]|uniref:style cell-cycle inhibitor 1-A n=1 Tax=Gastrolobium bilobum TaxID=150636 RepID=UPI002AAF87EA|nr:style cell-cycle inhibitor 1-A [Gastrolobium bilobum]
MGSDRKSKRTSFDSPSESQDEKKSKRQRTVEDEEKKNRKREKKEKRKDKKSHKHSKENSDKAKKLKDTHKSKHSKGDGHMEFQELSNDDYFAKNNEFATWLKEEKNVFFSDLLSESARELFSDFVKAWNRGKLESQYYEGIASGPRTSHNWKIKK